MVLSKGLRERMHILLCWGLMDLLSSSSSSGKLCKHGESLTMDFIKANPRHKIQCDSTEQIKSSQALTYVNARCTVLSHVGFLGWAV